MTDLSHLPYRPNVGIMLMNVAGLIFAGERLDMPGAWQMPQGGVDDGETPEVAALRELEEEIGVPESAVRVLRQTTEPVRYDLPADLIARMWGGKYRGQEQYWFLMQLEADDSAIDIETAHPEFGRWKWTTPADLIAEIVPFKRPVYEQVLRELLPDGA